MTSAPPEKTDEVVDSSENTNEIIIARRTESIDAPHIMKLAHPRTEELFGRININNLLEKAVLAITLVNGNGEILGHASFYDSPNVEDVDPAEWEDWISTMYSSKYTALNSLYLHYFVAKPEYANACANEIVGTMFNALPDVHFCILAVPHGVGPESVVGVLFRPLKLKEGGTMHEEYSLFATYRYEHSPVLYVRKARVEDNDDVTPLFNSLSETLKTKYGEYYVSELIKAQDEHMHCLAAEVNGYVIGLMSISDNLDLNFLNQNYDLGIFHDLIQPIIEPNAIGTDNIEEPCDEDGTSQLESAELEQEEISASVEGAIPEDSEPLETSSSSSKGEKPQVQLNLSDIHMRSGSESSITSPAREAAMDQDSLIYPHSPMETMHAITSVFKGEPNAFCIQLFAIDEIYEMRSEDFLLHAFELFPDRAICIITTPYLVPEFPLLQHFVRITPRLTSILDQELYVFHKDGLVTDLRVKLADTTNLDEIEFLTRNIHRNEHILKDIKQYLEAERDQNGTGVQVFIAIILNQVIGVAVIRDEEDIEYLRAHYNIEDYIYFNQHQRNEHGHFYHFVLNPAFKYLTKNFIKDILRRAHKTSLYYPLYPPYATSEVVGNHSLLTCLREMVPVSARRQIQYPPNLGINAPSDRILKKLPPFALCHINLKLILEPKITVNARIVVVGASTVGLSFLETLTYCPHLNFNNLTLVSSRGLPGQMCPDPLREGMIASDLCYEPDDHARIALRTWINVVSGQLTAINRKQKQIVIDNESLLPYDHLILCCGLQYTFPTPDPNEYSEPQPKNVFVINDGYQAENALKWLKRCFPKFSGDVLIYGDTIDAYCCIQTLLQMNIPAELIYLLRPPKNDKINAFPDPIVQSTILQSLQSIGVKILENYSFKCWVEHESSNVSKATFEGPSGFVDLEFLAMFCYQKKQINHKAIKAVRDCSLVFDGFVVIDNCFHTNDSSIRVAGPVTKYKRKYYADQWVHSNFNSKEVGIALATEMLKLFDPMVAANISAQKAETVNANLVPVYSTPKITSAVLPGNYHYLHVTKPGAKYREISLDESQGGVGTSLVTGKPNGSNGYFRIYLNRYSSVETITCLSKKPFPALNFVQLYGIHERILNNLRQRYQEGLIEDFFSFLMESWCLAIYLDRFPLIHEEIREKLLAEEAGIKEMLDTFLEDNSTETLGTSYSNLLLRKYENKPSPRMSVESHILNYLAHNYYHLPMYAKPGMI